MQSPTEPGDPVQLVPPSVLLNTSPQFAAAYMTSEFCGSSANVTTELLLLFGKETLLQVLPPSLLLYTGPDPGRYPVLVPRYICFVLGFISNARNGTSGRVPEMSRLQVVPSSVLLNNPVSKPNL